MIRARPLAPTARKPDQGVSASGTRYSGVVRRAKSRTYCVRSPKNAKRTRSAPRRQRFRYVLVWLRLCIRLEPEATPWPTAKT